MGWASPGEKISIKFNNKGYKLAADANGKWLIALPAMKAGGPYSMDINASNHIIINNILIGDVWFCSGQSNMVLNMERVKEKYPDVIAEANYPQIRNFFISTSSDVSKVHYDLPPGKWKEANAKNVLKFGAAAYFFARQIYNKYHIPIGIINSSVGGTPIQAWISEEGIKEIPQYSTRLVQLRDSVFMQHIYSAVSARIEADKIRTKPMDKGLMGPKRSWCSTAKNSDRCRRGEAKLFGPAGKPPPITRYNG